MTERNELLVAARDTFIAACLDAFDQFLPQTMETAFAWAENSRSSLEQSHYLTVRGVLRERHAELRLHLHRSLEKLLHRSLQTAYSTFRPAFSLAGYDGALSLVETSAFEGELRLVAFTDRFRNEAAEQLRDLNIRIALLFEQDEVKEREGPYRPYLVSRALADASDSMGLPKELADVLTQLLAQSTEEAIDGIYASVNSFLAKNGLAAELPLRIKKKPEQVKSRDERGADEASETRFDNAASSPALRPAPSQGGRAENFGNPRAAAAISEQSVEQFLQAIKNSVDIAARQQASRVEANPGAGGAEQASPDDAGAGSADSSVAGSHEQKINQLFEQVRRYREAISGFAGAADGAGSGAEGGGGNGAPIAAGSGFSQPQTPSAAKSGWLSGVRKVGEALRKFLGAGAQGSRPRRGQAYAPPDVSRALTVELTQSIDALLRAQAPDGADIVGSDGEVRNLILEQRSHLGEQTGKVDEQMTIDVVAMLFEFILRDTQVPAEVRAQLGRLQFLVLKLALRDPNLLTQKWHPARVLINRIGSISIGLKQIDPASIRVSAQISAMVETLLADHAMDLNAFVTVFARLLDDFDEFVAAELRSKDDKLDRAVQAMESAQSRTLRFAQISAQMADILSGLTLDTFLHDFLTDAWVQVIEHAEGVDMEHANRFRVLVPDLIWSIAPKADEFDREAMSAILPLMISTLREGLALIAWPQGRQQEVLGWLFNAHTRALRSINESFQIPSLPLMHDTFERLVKNIPVKQEQATESERRSAEKVLVDAAIRRLDTDIQSLDNYFDEQEAADANAGAAESPVAPTAEAQVRLDEVIADRLHHGILIEIRLDKTPARARLSWISDDASNLILTLDDERKPVLMSLRVFRRLLARERVQFIEDQPLFERAIKSLLDSAEHMDIESAAPVAS